MATIALYSNKANQMTGLINDFKNSVDDYKSKLFSLKSKSLTINKSVCDLDDVISSIQSSSQTQEDKIISLDTFRKDCEAFVFDVVSIDDDVADIIKERKEDFYEEYYYLKPECEKDDWEKVKDCVKGACEWCKENWVKIVTVLVVIAIAIVAVVVFGVAVAAVAAIAGIISLVLCAADVICMIATGGKSLATVFRENGWNVLADIFEGISIGCDLVSIILPVGAAIKSMAKVGIKTFVKASISSAKTAFREAVEALTVNGFKKGFKTGMKQLGKLFFKTFILDIDDLKNWKAVPLDMKGPTKNWINQGDQLVPSPSVKPGGKTNPNGLSMAEIMDQAKFSNFPDTIPYKNGYPDISAFSVADVDISMKNLDFDVDRVLSGDMSEKQFRNKLRDFNYKNADKVLKSETGMTIDDLENLYGFKLTRHEDLNMKKVYYVPYEIHANLGHTGGIGNYTYNFFKIPDISRLVGDKSTQWGFRFGAEGLVGATTDN